MSKKRPKKRGRGRPRTAGADLTLSLRIDNDSAKALDSMASEWDSSRGEVVRGALQTAAENGTVREAIGQTVKKAQDKARQAGK